MSFVGVFAWLVAYMGALALTGWVTERPTPSVEDLALFNAALAAISFALVLIYRLAAPRIQGWRNRGKGWPQQAIEDFQKGEPK